MARYREKGKIIAEEYHANCAELTMLLDTGNQPRIMDIADRPGRPSKTFDPVSYEKLKAARIENLRIATTAVQYALDTIGKMKAGDCITQLCEMVYFDRTHTLSQAATALGISDILAKKYSRIILELICFKMGYIPTKTNEYQG